MKKGLSKICYGFFSTLANPTRLAILENLLEGSLNVTNIAKILQQDQSMVSHNLKLLERCHFVSAEKKGKEKYFTINDESIREIFEIVKKHAKSKCHSDENCEYS
jgi:ArsR family transcriptional regulator